ncbi:glycosyltransferase [Nibribacter ruber]|uniref:Glycosyltransferase n=1 Tax=Nibribacter ruber TaxID=2698458 RepID=A0A6P1NWF2_9BACT|nr:glycosyltransferase [Nibribacter ruber]QHL85951.1 glycosyltransferase [Nibribacter ruber]
MNYWLLTTEFPPFFGGGISTYCYFTSKMLQANGHSVSVFINDSSVNGLDVKLLDGVRIVRFNPSKTNASAFLGHVTNISYEFAEVVKQFVQEEGQPDVIEAQEYLGIAYYLLQFKYLKYDWCKNIPVVITMHSPSFLYMEYNHVLQYKYPNYWVCEMERFCLQAADLLLSPSQFMLNELANRFTLTNQNTAVVPNPYEGEVKGRKAIPNKNFPDEIVFFGKLTYQKGASILLTYFKELWDGGFREPLILIGGQDIVYHPEGKTMGDLIRRKYKEYIDQGLLKLEDRIEPSQIQKRLSNAKVVIIPSMNDNLPYVVFEMMAMGKVVLASKQGGHSEVIEHGKDGFIFDHGQPGTFAQQLNHVLQLSEKERKAISVNAIHKVQNHYNLQAIYTQKMGLVSKLLKKKELVDTYPFVRVRKSTLPVKTPLALPDAADLLTVIIPFYNLGEYVEETIASVRKSTGVNKEILIVNDGSNDPKSLKVLEKLRKAKDCIVIDTKNAGLAAARNTGAKNAQGKYIAFLDADDKVAPEYFAKALKVLQHNTNVHFVGAWTQYFGDSSKVWPTFSPEPPVILYHNMVNSSSLVYKKESFLHAGLNDGQMPFQGLEDYESVISLLENGLNGVVLPEVLFHYRVRKDSMIREVSSVKMLVLYEYLSKKHKEFYSEYAAEVFSLTNANGSGVVLDNPSLDFQLIYRFPFNSRLGKGVIKVVKKNKYLKSVAFKAFNMIKK